MHGMITSIRLDSTIFEGSAYIFMYIHNHIYVYIYRSLEDEKEALIRKYDMYIHRHMYVHTYIASSYVRINTFRSLEDEEEALIREQDREDLAEAKAALLREERYIYI
jgi:hypothetical protein